ncbi:hypothetical protein [Patulibacter americanus]|uniref:hypothetical protein n=1 Tax=Patulibacter americanus TaxID=588672 RepID=UPI0003B59811|nr:hypothetical protein [Patulibacter americanus]
MNAPVPAVSRIDLAAAETFIRLEARLIDVRRFERAFGDGDDASVRRALEAYRNADGGYAGLLEPDLRTPISQPQAAELALRVLDEVGGVPAEVGQALCDWLATVSAPGGGVPFTHPSARAHPAAPHWHHADGTTASLNPTAAIVGLLHRHGIEHPWRDEATAWCWRALGVGDADAAAPEALDLYSVRAALWLLEPAVPASPDPAAVRERLAVAVREHVALDPALTAPGAPGHHIGPLEVAPFPDDPGRALIPATAVDAALDALEDRQAADGGWEINFEPISAAGLAGWRGWATLGSLLILRANGRLGTA